MVLYIYSIGVESYSIKHYRLLSLLEVTIRSYHLAPTDKSYVPLYRQLLTLAVFCRFQGDIAGFVLLYTENHIIFHATLDPNYSG